MPAITQQDVAEIVGDMIAFYMPDREACGKATPAQMRLMLDRLKIYTDQVKKAAQQHGMDHDKNVPMFAVDMARWDQRLAHYSQVLSQIPSEQGNTAAGCELVYQQVTAPLLDGIWYEILPGINLNQEEKDRMLSGVGHSDPDVLTQVNGHIHPGGHSNAKPPDVATPFMLGNQVVVYKEHQDERLRQFWRDLKQSAVELPKRIAERAKKALKPIGRDFLLPLGVTLLGLSAATVTVMAVLNRRSAKRSLEEMGKDRELNPHRRRKRPTLHAAS